ncbi:MAG: EAL domain-containing protein [Methylococcaceae bacterium]|nr:EAL domain-containing protein [Methylococcaceae bacterium]
MESSIGAINLERYLPFIEMVSENECTLALFGKVGELYNSSHSSQQRSPESLFNTDTEYPVNWSSLSANNHFIELSESRVLFVEKLELGATQQEFWLTLTIKLAVSQITSEQKTRLIKLLQTIGICIAEDYTTNISLKGMAEELGVRYEELNLLYGLEDNNEFLSNRNEHDALNQLLQNCTDYLNVGLIALFIPEQDLIIHHVGLNDATIDLDIILKNLRGSLLQWMKTNHDTLVINRDTATNWSDTSIDIPYKIIATPLLKASGNIAGILLLVNSLKAQDFTNSDRKLAEVLTTEATKLIRERRDKLTELFNRKGFYEKMELAVDQVRSSGKEFWLIFLDLDQFKHINDVSGHIAGDKLLIQVGSLIKKQLKKNDVIARFGADEFAVLLEGYSFADVQIKAEEIRRVIHQFRFVYESKMYDTAISIGVVWVDPTAESISELLSSADVACRVAKENGGNRVHIYHSSDQQLLIHEDHMQWIGRINKSLENDHFVLYRQKILPLTTDNNEEHYELLIRLKDENGDIISPIQFIPAAERYGLMAKLDRWVIKTALAKMVSVYAKKPETTLEFSINLSGQSFCEPGFQEYLIDQVISSGIPPHRICFEMTETVAVSNLSQASDFMQAVKEIGCKFSLDDFGSGMSSFTYLKNLPVDYLKIDGYFVKTILENKIDRAMVESINQIGQVMGLKTIAEFVENDAILSELKKIGVDYAQGYGIGKPEPF